MPLDNKLKGKMNIKKRTDFTLESNQLSLAIFHQIRCLLMFSLILMVTKFFLWDIVDYRSLKDEQKLDTVSGF